MTLQEFLQKLRTNVEEYNKNLPFRILPYVLKNIQPFGVVNPNGIRGRNTTNKLYRRTGNLVQALRQNGLGNISRVESRGDTSSLTFGIDLNVIPYARIHEFGGRAGNGAYIPPRPYLNPGIEEFRRTALRQIQLELYRKIRTDWDRVEL